jgi:hypothetical protein
MILLCGIPSESPVEMVGRALDALGLPHITFNQRRFARARLAFEVACGRVTGSLALDGQTYRLEEIGGVYNRLMDEQALPELRALPADDPLRGHCRTLHDALIQWMEIAPARVVNRAWPMGSNVSKPFQMQLIAREGFAVPETLVTNDPDLVREFHRQHGRVIYKSISSVRSIVQVLQPDDYARLERIRWCPTQFQAFVDGTNVRVHVIGERTFAVRVRTEAIDYRYAAQQGSTAELEPTELDEALRARCVHLARALDLPFAGIDLKITPGGEVFCFEVNPSPGFSYYEAATGQPIADAVARYLAGEGVQ